MFRFGRKRQPPYCSCFLGAGWLWTRLTPVCSTLIILRTQRLVHLHQRTFVDAYRPGILPDVTDVVNSARQNIKVSIFDGLKCGDLELGVPRDLFQTDPVGLPDGRYAPVI